MESVAASTVWVMEPFLFFLFGALCCFFATETAGLERSFATTGDAGSTVSAVP